LGEELRYRLAMRTKAVCYVYLGRMEEARNWANRVLELDPGFTIARLKASGTYLLPPEPLARYVDGLRKAGLPEE
jgi:adenylate cyclase